MIIIIGLVAFWSKPENAWAKPRCVGLLLVSACHCYRYPTEVADSPDAAVPPGAASLVPSVAPTAPPSAAAISADALAATPAHTVKDGLASVTNLDQMTRSANMTRMTNMSHLLVGGAFPMLPALCPNSIIPHSNRTAEAPCRDPNRPSSLALEGTECFFVPKGVHTAQPTRLPVARPKWVRNNSFYKDHDHKLMAWKVEPDHRYIFWGGRCEPLCGTKTCAAARKARVGTGKKSTLVSERLSRAEDCMETGASTARTTC